MNDFLPEDILAPSGIIFFTLLLILAFLLSACYAPRPDWTPMQEFHHDQYRYYQAQANNQSGPNPHLEERASFHQQRFKELRERE